MTEDSTGNLPPDYAVSVEKTGAMTLFWDDSRVWVFPSGHPRQRIEDWATGHEAGRKQGSSAGEAKGRQDLACDLRRLLQVA